MNTNEEAVNPTTQVGAWTLLPAKAGTCPECATNHPPEQPHNAQSLHYQYRFFGLHGRWPNWLDAMAHCDEETKGMWRHALIEEGVNVEGGKVGPSKPAGGAGEGPLRGAAAPLADGDVSTSLNMTEEGGAA